MGKFSPHRLAGWLLIGVSAWSSATAPTSGWRDNWGRIQGVYTSGQALCDALNQVSPAEAPFTYHDDPTVLGGYTASGYCSSKDGFSRAAPATRDAAPAPDACPLGYHDEEGICQQDPDSCPSGQHRHFVNVIAIGSSVMSVCSIGENPCPAGQTHLDDLCVVPAVDPPVATPETPPRCPDGTHPIHGYCKLPPVANDCPHGATQLGTDSSGTPICTSTASSTDTAQQNTPEKTPADPSDDTQSTTTSDPAKEANHGDGATTPSSSTTMASTHQQDKSNQDTKTEDAADDRPVRSDGDLYSKKSKTFQTVMENWQHKVGEAPFIVTAKRFLSVSVNKGSCPQWPLSVPYFHINVHLGEYFCGTAMSSALEVIGIGVMIGAALVAFRMAFL